MKALILHDETGKIISAAVTDADIDLQLLPHCGEFVLEVDTRELELGDVTALTEEHAGRVRAALAKVQETLRVDVRALRPTNRLIKV